MTPEQKVTLIESPSNLLETFYTACSTCYSAENPEDIFHRVKFNPYQIEKQLDRTKMIKLIKKVVNAGHQSTVEHGDFVFAISGVSRAFTHQAVRTRHASFSQKSQRYVDSSNKEGEFKQFKYVTPPSFKKLPLHLQAEYDQFMSCSQGLYDDLVAAGAPPEDARFVLPNATETAMVMSINLRSMINTAQHRLCVNSQWEYQHVFQAMCDKIIEVEPWLAEFLVPICVSNGFCKELKPCGRFITKKEMQENSDNYISLCSK